MKREKRSPLTLFEAAARLGVSARVARNALRRGELRGFKIGRLWRVLPESVERKRAGE
jgi:excisionase family DNA binding protein